MATKSRRKERNHQIIAQLREQFEVRAVNDISDIELQGKYLESTGVIIFDHLQKTMYGCVSDRCNEQLFNEHAKTLGYQPILFHAFDISGAPIYHTNVMMGIQTSTVVICAESISDKKERDSVISQLKLSGRTVIEITYDQMAAFCGNVLELRNENGERFIAMSRNAQLLSLYLTICKRESLIGSGRSPWLILRY
jgi:hypothetical protein